MEAAGGGEDEVARGRGRRRTGEWPGGVVVQGGRGVEAAELGRLKDPCLVLVIE